MVFGPRVGMGGLGCLFGVIGWVFVLGLKTLVACVCIWCFLTLVLGLSLWVG